MLTQEAISSALPLTTVLDDRSAYIDAIQSTPLADLVLATRADRSMFGMLPGSSEPQVDISAMHYVANARDKTLNVSQHDISLDEIAQVGIRSVQEQMQRARTVAAPAIANLVERVEVAMRDMVPSALAGMNVAIWAPPAPMLVPAFTSMTGKYANTPYESPSLDMKLPSRTVQEMAELMHTGSSSVDSAIDEWIAVRGETFFNSLWQSVFQVTTMADGAPTNFAGWVENAETGLDAAVAIFLISRKLLETGPMEGTEMRLQAFENRAADFRNQAGARIARVLDDMKRTDKAGILVRQYRNRNTVVVNGEVYRKWIEAGGSNEVLFGACVKGLALVSTSQLDEQKEALLSAWRRFEGITATTEASKRFERIKDLLEKCFQQQLREISDEEEATEGNRMVVMKIFREELAKIRVEDTDDLWSLCLRLVCRSRFYRTECERILGGIERVKRKNPNLSVREAAAISMIEYISWWVAQQMTVRKL